MNRANIITFEDFDAKNTIIIDSSVEMREDISRDISNHEDGNTYGTQLTFLYPPRENKPTLADGLTSDEMFVKENMEDKLSGKVRRNNNIVVEIQGSVIITSK